MVTTGQPPVMGAWADFTAPPECHGLRLDQALTRMMPGLGRRGARRFCEQSRVQVDGRRQAGGYRLRTGQHVRLVPPEAAHSSSGEGSAGGQNIQIAARTEAFAALVKPAGMHSADIAGSSKTSIQAALPELFPGLEAVLLNRLDQPVSGLALIALHEDAVRNYATWQDQGRVRKQYLAVVSGCLKAKMQIVAALDTARRRKVRILAATEPSPLRRTLVRPLHYQDERNQTLVEVEIFKGRRHQIRAHMAAIGHPVVHDPLYGADPDLGWIYLHHASISLPGFAAVCPPRWDGWDSRPDTVAAFF